MADQANDGRPDVEIRSTAKPADAMTDHRWEYALERTPVTYEVACRWCPESLSTLDVRSAFQWADKHEQSLGHSYSKAERIEAGSGPRELWS